MQCETSTPEGRQHLRQRVDLALLDLLWGGVARVVAAAVVSQAIEVCGARRGVLPVRGALLGGGGGALGDGVELLAFRLADALLARGGLAEDVADGVRVQLPRKARQLPRYAGHNLDVGRRVHWWWSYIKH